MGYFDLHCRHTISEQTSWYHAWSIQSNEVSRLCKYLFHFLRTFSALWLLTRLCTDHWLKLFKCWTSTWWADRCGNGIRPKLLLCFRQSDATCKHMRATPWSHFSHWSTPFHIKWLLVNHLTFDSTDLPLSSMLSITTQTVRVISRNLNCIRYNHSIL